VSAALPIEESCVRVSYKIHIHIKHSKTGIYIPG
jgi:hypothetical protein